MYFIKKLKHYWVSSNNLKYLSVGLLTSVANLFLSGSILQSFMLENGISEKNVAFFMSALQIVQVSVMLCMSPVVDRIKRIIKVNASVNLSVAVYALLLAAISVLSGFSPDVKYSMVLIGGIAVNVFLAVNNILCYKVPFLIMDINDYGHLNGKIGIVGGIIGAAVSAMLSFLTAYFDFNGVMLVMYIISAVFVIVSSFIIFSYKPINQEENEKEDKKKEKKSVNIFKYSPFYVLILPNLLRGFNSGVFGTAMTIGFYLGIADKSSGSTLTLVLQIATLVSSFLYTIFTKKKLDDIMIIISSAVMALSMSLMVIGDVTWFYITYCVASFVINIINNAVPTAVMRIVDYDHIGQFTTWRMLCHTLGGAVASAVVIGMIDILGGVLTMILAAICQLISGVVYYIYIQILKKQNKYLM